MSLKFRNWLVAAIKIETCIYFIYCEVSPAETEWSQHHNLIEKIKCSNVEVSQVIEAKNNPWLSVWYFVTYSTNACTYFFSSSIIWLKTREDISANETFLWLIQKTFSDQSLRSPGFSGLLFCCWFCWVNTMSRVCGHGHRGTSLG